MTGRWEREYLDDYLEREYEEHIERWAENLADDFDAWGCDTVAEALDAMIAATPIWEDTYGNERDMTEWIDDDAKTAIVAAAGRLLADRAVG